MPSLVIKNTAAVVLHGILDGWCFGMQLPFIINITSYVRSCQHSFCYCKTKLCSNKAYNVLHCSICSLTLLFISFLCIFWMFFGLAVIFQVTAVTFVKLHIFGALELCISKLKLQAFFFQRVLQSDKQDVRV